MADITVHHLNKSRSLRVLWLLEELGLDYDIQRYQRDPDTMLAPPELRKIHPLGKAPIVQVGETILAESGAIAEYLADRYGDGKLAPPPGTPGRQRYIYWLHYAEGSIAPPLLLKLVFDRLEAAPMPFFVRPIAKSMSGKVRAAFLGPQLKLHLDYLEGELSGRPWFAGQDFTAADVLMSYPLEVATERAGLDATRPALMDFLARIHARPAYQRAQERAQERGGD